MQKTKQNDFKIKITIELSEEETNNLITISEEKNIEEEQYLYEAFKEKIKKDISKYEIFC